MKSKAPEFDNTPVSTRTLAFEKKQFAADILKGLTKHPKKLSSKYFYDAQGSKLFQQIMELPEYYLTRTETEIFNRQQKEIIYSLTVLKNQPINIVDLGAGDATKTKILLKQLLKQKVDFTYIPVDISEAALVDLAASLTTELPQLNVTPVASDYFAALQWIAANVPGPKILLFLGSNIGNFDPKAIRVFARKLRSYLIPGDQLLMGFDLQKDPHRIRQAYDDASGVTAAFNYNLLDRINQEFKGNISIPDFKHFAEYNPVTGDMKSYLVSTKLQEIYLEELDFTFSVAAWEAIHTETSHKFTVEGIKILAAEAGFIIKDIFTDEKQYFADVLFAVTA